jgi:hypothetical protein
MEVRTRIFEKADKDLLDKALKERKFYELRDGEVIQLKDGKSIKVQGLRDGAVIAPRVRVEGGRAFIARPGVPNRALRPGQAQDVQVFVRSGSKKGSQTFQVDAEKFIKSLTADQKFQMRTRGFLYYVDLTKEQKAMLGAKPTGRFELKFNVNGEEVTVKGS